MNKNTAVEKTQDEKSAVDRLFNFRPVFFAAIFLCLGILYVYLRDVTNGIPSWAVIFLLPVAAIPFLFCRSYARIKKTALAIVTLFLFFCIGATSFSVCLRNFKETPLPSGEYTVSGRIVESKKYDWGYSVVLDDVCIGGKDISGKLNAYLPTSFAKNTQLSDTVLLMGNVRRQELFEEGKFNVWAIEDNLQYTLESFESGSVTGNSFDLFLFLRSRMERAIYSGMNDTAAAVTLAVLTGNTSAIDADLLENVRRGGVAHIFAVSGLHIGALYAFCAMLLKKTPLKKTNGLVKFVFLASVLIGYGGICGFSASVVRAIVMCLAFHALSSLGVPADMLESIGLAAIVLLTFSPVSLFSVGCQLSFAACLGIALLSRPLNNLLGGRIKPKTITINGDEDTLPLTIPQRMVRAVVSFLSVSLAAQLATTPILYLAFGYVSIWSLFLNCIFVPFLSMTFSFLLLFVFISCLLPLAISGVVLYVPSVVWSTVLLLFEAVDFSSISLSGFFFPAAAVISYYAGLLFISDKWNVSKMQKRVLIGICFLTFAVSMFALNV